MISSNIIALHRLWEKRKIYRYLHFANNPKFVREKLTVDSESLHSLWKDIGR